MDKPKCCWQCKYLISYNPEEDMCKLDGHIFESKLCLSIIRDKECPLDIEELKGGMTYGRETYVCKNNN